MKIIMKCLFGSHLYKLNTENSDKDYKGIYLPEKRELLLGNYAKQYNQSTGNDTSKNTKDDVDTEIFSLPRFIELAIAGETFALDMLHAEPIYQNAHYTRWEEYIWHELQANRQKFYTKDMKSYVGYSRKQANKYGIKGSRMASVEKLIHFLTETNDFTPAKMSVFKVHHIYGMLPTDDHLRRVEMEDKSQGNKPLRFYEVCGRKYQDTLTLEQLLNHVKGIYDEYGDRAKQAKDNAGVDFKAVSHALRAAYQCLGILKDGDFEYPLPQTEYLLKVKTGQLNFVEEVQPELERVIEEIEALCLVSKLPQKADRKYWDDWLLDVYEEYL